MKNLFKDYYNLKNTYNKLYIDMETACSDLAFEMLKDGKEVVFDNDNMPTIFIIDGIRNESYNIVSIQADIENNEILLKCENYPVNVGFDCCSIVEKMVIIDRLTSIVRPCDVEMLIK